MENIKMPEHIAIIMDGNRRWAKSKNLPIKLGHKQGAETLKAVVRHANKIGLKYITVYAFSTENWKRAEEEVKALMMLLQNYLDDYAKRADTENIKVQFFHLLSQFRTISNFYILHVFVVYFHVTQKILKNKTSVLCGSSGVGKSSLINALNPNLKLRTKEISEKTQRGTHTTRHCEIIKINNTSRIVDTPGFSNVKFDFILPNDVDLLFADICSFH